MSLETAQKVIVPQKKNYVPQFLKQRDINSYCFVNRVFRGPSMRYLSKVFFPQIRPVRVVGDLGTRQKIQKHYGWGFILEFYRRFF
jgi:hypothetical protein